MTVPSRFEYRRLDVFTDEAFGGNPLAVFLDAGDLTTVEMQKIAREMNLSESAFVTRLAASPVEWSVRFFTPAMELPFAGHPTVGTAITLVLEGLAECDDQKVNLVLHEAVGAVPVTVTRNATGALHAMVSVPKLPEFGPADVPVDDLAALLSVDVEDVLTGAWRARTITCGVPFYFIALRSLTAIRRVRLRRDLWEARLEDHWAPHLYVICPEVERAGSAIHARMFPPAMGVDEDPATGGAAAALAGFLVDAQRPEDGLLRWRIEQGFELGRPSLIYLEADISNGAIAVVRLGGSAAPMGGGAIVFNR